MAGAGVGTTVQKITAFYAGLGGGKVDDPAIALSDAVAQDVDQASAASLKPFELWAVNLSGYLTTGQSSVTPPAARSSGPPGRRSTRR